MITIRAEFKHNTTDGIAYHDHKAETVQAAVEAAINFMKPFNYRFVGCVVIAEGL